jgi:hypothetical protein
MITDEHFSALQGMFPSWITTCSAAGEPNTSVISQIWYVDENHVALSNQFFNKTKRNIAENPFAYASIINPSTLGMFNLELEFDHTEAEGDLFDEMEMKLEAIASMSGMSGIFRLLGADVYKLTSIKTFR